MMHLSHLSEKKLGLGDISFLHRYRDFAGCDMYIAEIAISAIIKKRHENQVITPKLYNVQKWQTPFLKV